MESTVSTAIKIIATINLIVGFIIGFYFVLIQFSLGAMIILSSIVSAALLIGFAHIIDYLGELSHQTDVQIRTQSMMYNEMKKTNAHLEKYFSEVSQIKNPDADEIASQTEIEAIEKVEEPSEMEVDESKEVPFQVIGYITRYFKYKYSQSPSSIKATNKENHYIVYIGTNLSKVVKVEGKKIIEL